MNETGNAIYIETLLALLLVASATAVITKWVPIPYSVALVIAGLIIGLSGVLPPVSMTPELVLLIFLPTLLFEASLNLDLEALRRDWLSISVLATFGVVVYMFAVAAVLHSAGGMNVGTALLFGAMGIRGLSRKPSYRLADSMVPDSEARACHRSWCSGCLCRSLACRLRQLNRQP